ncbi:MAG: c-type cytochrome biogenesis protein CcmI [Rhodospirillales bacterium]
MTALWVAATVLTLATLALLLVPLLRRCAAVPPRAAFDLSVYRAQLAEVDRDVERGLLDAEQAVAARIEVERRMLAAAGGITPAASPPRARWGGLVAAAAVVVFVPAGAFGLYLVVGAPGVPDQPLAARDQPSATATMEAVSARLSEHLQTHPGDVDGWIMLGRSYLTMERFPQAVEAFARARTLAGGDADVAAAYGEALVGAAGGQVTPEAGQAFREALDADPIKAKARYYLALDQAQRGDLEGALEGWVSLVRVSPPNASWLPIVRQQIGRAAAALGIETPAAEPMAETEMSAEESGRMIRSMVEGLAARLEQDPDDRQGWLRLAQAYEVLGEADKARDARARAAALAGSQ